MKFSLEYQLYPEDLRSGSSANHKGYILGAQVFLVGYITMIASLWKAWPRRSTENECKRSESATSRMNSSLLSNNAWCPSTGSVCLGITQTA